MNDEIFLVQDGQRPVKMASQPYESEDLLQRLLAENPEILGSKSLEGAPRRWRLVSREQGVPDAAGSPDRWALDHLFLDQDAVPTLIEVKRARDTRARREVVAQMLDYAANGVVYWPIANLREGFNKSCADRNENVAEVILDLVGEDVDEDEFWRRVEGNMRQGRIRMVFVADQIPDELRRIVEFLNGQMRPAVVLALEVKQYLSAQGARTLVPRLLGNTTAAETAKSVSGGQTVHSLEEWIQVFADRNGRELADTARDLIDVLRSIFDTVDITKSQDSVFTSVVANGHERYPIFLRIGGWVEIATRWIKNSPIFASEGARQEILDRAEKIAGVKLSTRNLAGFPALRLEALASEQARLAFKEFAAWLASRLREEGP